MKNIIIFFLTLQVITQAYTQGVAINSTGIISDPSAILDISSSDQGLLIPRVNLISNTDAFTISNPATSLLVYNTNISMLNGSLGYWYNSGTPLLPEWKKFTDTPGGFSHYLGEYFGGGIIYYLYRGNDGLEHGLILNTSENSSSVYQTTASTTNADRSEDGAYNSALITNSPAITYVSSLGSGWYLPSVDELILLFNSRYVANKALRAGGYTLIGFGLGNYWTSTEDNFNSAFYINFFTGDIGWSNKSNFMRVRAIRSF